ncbi:hypothetical protein VE03_05859 [Pseudogymnoascus sp. 23342-1-I1]|nr:hypothetical protein VE03_05859 [Pseudogymnoascus sp. 23342-1-I1]
MIISEIPSDSPPPRQFFANQPPPTAPRIIEEVPNTAAQKTLAELFASYPKAGQPSAPADTNYPSQNAPVSTYPEPSQSSIYTSTTHPIPRTASASSYNPTQHIGPPPQLWFPPRPPGQDIDGNTTIPDNPWTPVPFSATMEDAPCTPGRPPTPRSRSVSMPDRPMTPVTSFFSGIAPVATNAPSEPAKFLFPKSVEQPPGHHSGANLHFQHLYTEPSISRNLATAPALPDPPTSAPKYVNPFLPRPITLPPRIPIPPRSSAENVSPRTPTAPVPHFPDAPLPDLSSHPSRVPPTVHVLADWPYGPLLDALSPHTRRFAMGGTDGNDLKIYRPCLNRETYIECLPPTTRVEVHCTSRACGIVCEFDGRAAEACSRRSAAAKDVALWDSKMWACEGCGEEMEMQVTKESEGNSPTDTGDDACDKKDERDG